jgi:hypothetical protein
MPSSSAAETAVNSHDVTSPPARCENVVIRSYEVSGAPGNHGDALDQDVAPE